MYKQIIKNSDIAIQIDSKIINIAECLNNSQQSAIDIMGGKAGEILFWAHYSLYKKDEVILNKVTAILSEVFEEIEKGFNYPTFAGGVAGIGWIVEYLVENDFINADTNEIIGSLDDFLYPLMLNFIREGNYDYLHGALGIGLYFLKRQTNKSSLKYLLDLVNELDKIAIKDDSGVRWLSELDRNKNTKGFNLSLSHGMSSIIAFLSKLYSAGIAEEKVIKLLNGAVKYLLSQQLNILKHKSNFPNWVCSEEPATHSRLAWCYGDLGIGMALWQAGNNTKNELWKEKAIEILLHSTKRRDLKENSVVDAGLCHGAAGIAHIYNRMYRLTKINAFKESAEYWFNQTLEMAIHKDSISGFKAYRIEKHGGSYEDFGFLEGIAGIGLTLISAVSDIEPKWDECLLLS
ncbi:MAG: hypothetical protein GQ564_15275 [Bacteroidales bacterium]|nr:hypothetical protein [Bacteroidales bacterium]